MDKISAFFKKEWKNILRAAVILAIISVIALKWDDLRHFDLKSIVDQAPSIWVAILLVWAVFILKAVTLIMPAAVLYLTIGMIFDPWVAVFCSITGVMLEVAVTYWLGYFLSGNMVNKLLKLDPKAGTLLSSYTTKGAVGIIFVRISPMPIDIVSLLLGNTKYPFVQYYAFSLIGLVPYVSLFTLLGNALYLLPSYINVGTIVIALVVIFIGIVAFFVIKHKRDEKKQEKNSGSDV